MARWIAAIGLLALLCPVMTGGASAEEDGIWVDVWGCKIWVKNRARTISTEWSGSCMGGKAEATGTFIRVFHAEDDAVVTETYNGSWIQGVQQGKGSYADSLGARYEGAFEDGVAHGHGTYVASDGSRYEGDWRGGRRAGQGMLVWGNGVTYEGAFQDDLFHGRGTLLWADGTRYEGRFENGVRRGPGVLYYVNGDEVHGEFDDGRLVGTGRCLRDNKSRWFECRQDGDVIKAAE